MADTRIPIGLAVELRFGELSTRGTTRDVSKSGLCVVVTGLPGAEEKALAEGSGADAQVIVALGRRKVELPGKISWHRKLTRGGEWLLGVEYAGAPEQAAAVTSWAEQRLHRPRVIRGMAFAGALVLAAGVAFFFWYESKRADALAELDRQFIETVRLRNEKASELEELRGEIASLRASSSSQGEELAGKEQQLAAVQHKFETLRQQVGVLSVSRADFKEEPKTGLHHLERGHRFSKDNNLAAALIEYEKAVQLVPDLAEAHLEMAVINDLYGRTQQAIDGYKRYLSLRPEALDAYEIRMTIKELESEARVAR